MASMVQSYKGYKIKQYTKCDVAYGKTLGEYAVVTRDNEPEYDDVGSLREARELIDGLVSDKLNDKLEEKRKEDIKKCLNKEDICVFCNIS